MKKNIRQHIHDVVYNVKTESDFGLKKHEIRKLLDEHFPALTNDAFNKKLGVVTCIVHNGETVLYASADGLRATLEYDFEQEKKFRYKGLSEQEIIEHIAHFISNLSQIHVFGEGNTRTTAIFVIKYLWKLGFKNVNNDLFAEHSWYFRNALVRANYEDLSRGIYRTEKFLINFLSNLLLKGNIPLKNREMHIFSDTVNDTVKSRIDTVNDTVFSLLEQNNNKLLRKLANA
jgi:hypothetical protein